MSRSDILDIQSEVMAPLGDVAGFKVGRQPDGPPILAPIPARYRVANHGSRAVRDRLGIELEVGFELLRPLPGGDLPEDIQNYFRPCVVLELVGTRIEGVLAEDPDYKFADFQINAGLVKGNDLPGWDGSDFGTLNARLLANGAPVLDGETTVPGGSALANLALLVAHLGTHCGGLQVGQVVITGSICGLPYFGPGTEIEGEIEGLGRVTLSLT
ncbi:hydratase [Celeribacter neptunius]|uniref:hydratase n=1 Tax=Celeribacter neptunius TaxID=588602 RepID=UPI0011602522|nr:hydratase [Celeribacter neptunius]